MPQLVQASDFGKQLVCQYNPLGGISVDSFGRTNIKGIYVAGDASVITPAQTVIAAAEGVRAAAGLVAFADRIALDLFQARQSGPLACL